MGIPYILFATSLKTISAQEAGLIALLEPVLNPVLVFFIFYEIPSVTTLIGGAIILTAIGGRLLQTNCPTNGKAGRAKTLKVSGA